MNTLEKLNLAAHLATVLIAYFACLSLPIVL